MKQVIVLLGLASIFAGTVAVAGKMTDVFDDRPPPPDFAVRTVETTTPDQGVSSELDQGGRQNRENRRAAAEARWVRAANAACADANREARAVIRTYGAPGSMAEFVELGEAGLAMQQELLDRLSTLKRPPRQRAEIGRMLAAHRRGAQLLRRMLSAVREGRYAVVLRWAEAGTSALMEASDSALVLGARRCAGSESRSALGSIGVAVPN